MHDLGAAARRHLGTADDSMYWALCARAVPGRRHDSTVRYAVMIAAAYMTQLSRRATAIGLEQISLLGDLHTHISQPGACTVPLWGLVELPAQVNLKDMSA